MVWKTLRARKRTKKTQPLAVKSDNISDTSHSNETALTFWEHLDVLRACLIKIITAIVISGVTAFFFKEQLFDIVLAPSHSNFIAYRMMRAEPFVLHLINTGLTEQFMIHLKVAIMAGVICVSPYIIYVLFGFISPALYANERQVGVKVVTAGYTMFIVGMAVNYLLIFPLTVRFLGTYQVSADIDNMLTVSSYIDTMVMMTLMFGIVFELPVVCWILSIMGLLRQQWMTHFRRHAVVAILIVAAAITPTADIFTLLMVALPIWALYEMSILIVRMTENNKKDKTNTDTQLC